MFKNFMLLFLMMPLQVSAGLQSTMIAIGNTEGSKRTLELSVVANSQADFRLTVDSQKASDLGVLEGKLFFPISNFAFYTEGSCGIELKYLKTGTKSIGPIEVNQIGDCELPLNSNFSGVYSVQKEQ